MEEFPNRKTNKDPVCVLNTLVGKQVTKKTKIFAKDDVAAIMDDYADRFSVDAKTKQGLLQQLKQY